MAPIRWTDAYSVGVRTLDEQHKGLIEQINRFEAAGTRTAVITSVLAALDRYAKEHFRTEEALMRACGYERLQQHELEHRVFEEWLLAIKLTFGFSSNTDEFANTVNAFLRNWLINHILKSDMDYKDALAAHREPAPVHGAA